MSANPTRITLAVLTPAELRDCRAVALIVQTQSKRGQSPECALMGAACRLPMAYDVFQAVVAREGISRLTVAVLVSLFTRKQDEEAA